MGEPARQIYAPEQVTEELRVSLKTILNDRWGGQLPGFTVGRLWRISERDLQCLLQ